MKTAVTVETVIAAPIEKVWMCWAEPEHITHWNFASDDWHAPSATNDLRVGGRFSYRMEARDGSAGFDFSGTYAVVEERQRIEYVMDGEDARKVSVEFAAHPDGCRVVETFETEETNPIELQRAGWQAILDNFKKHVLAV
ncbi:MAG: SRPBCC family protein [Candidatus Moranbacteria bacterium]|nr:SRPBCC family protein [Candidatus Moranbacteria bacterium]